MSSIKIFENKEFGEIRTVMIDGEPWFVGKDVAGALGYEKERNAVQKYVDTDDALKWGIIDSLGREQQTTIINESGLYALIFGSKLEKAKSFKHWVTSEVLPSIRQTSTYSVVKNAPLTEHPGEVANLIKAVTSRMDKQGSAPYETMDVTQRICEQYGIRLPENVVRIPKYEQIEMHDFVQ